MRTYQFNRILFLTITVLLSAIFSSCIKEELVDPPKVTLITDWSNRTEGVAIPSTYKVVIDKRSYTCKTTASTLPELSAGTYPIYVYNTPDKITIDGTSATIATSGDNIETKPGYLFYSTTDVVFENNRTNTVTLAMQQQVRQLNIELTITNENIDKIESITGSLSGVANSLDMKTGSYSGSGLKAGLVFTQSGNKLFSSIRLIGLTSEAQNLTLNVNYKGEIQQKIVADVSSFLSNFEKDKYMPLTLKGEAEIYTTIDMQMTIKKWEIQDVINGTIEF